MIPQNLQKNNINNDIKLKPPSKWGLIFFIFIILSHFIILLFIYIDIKYIFLTIIEIIFYFILNENKLKIIRILIITVIIFILNLIFSEGKILFKFGIIKITESGLINGLQKSGLIFNLFLFTNNILNKSNKMLINQYIKDKNNLIVLSIKYFYTFFEFIQRKITYKNIIKNIIRNYKNIETIPTITNDKNTILSKLFIIYNLSFIFCFIILVVL